MSGWGSETVKIVFDLLALSHLRFGAEATALHLVLEVLVSWPCTVHCGRVAVLRGAALSCCRAKHFIGTDTYVAQSHTEEHPLLCGMHNK